MKNIPTFKELIENKKYWKNDEEYQKQQEKKISEIEKVIKIENYKIKKN